jgi:nucleotide-binding universal stress UspA family protein
VKRILVPVDGSKLSEEALVPALALANRHGAALDLVHVVPDLTRGRKVDDGSATFQSWLAGEEARGKAYVEGLRGGLDAGPGVTVTAHALVGIGLVAEKILELADKLQADLIVLTSHGRGSWERIWLGSVAERLLRTAKQPLLVLRSPGDGSPPFPADGLPNHVLVPLDGTPQAEGVLETLRTVLDPDSGKISLVSVLPHFATLVTPYPPEALVDVGADPERAAQVEAYLAELKNRVRSWRKGPVDHRVVRDDDVARSLLRFAEGEGVDLIALSTHGRQGLDRLVLGSVVDKVIRGSKTAVLTVRRKT